MGHLRWGVLLSLSVLAFPTAGTAATWKPVTGSTSSIQQVGTVRGALPSAALHVVWARDTPGSAGSTQDILHVAIGADGSVGRPTTVAGGFSGVSNPAIVNGAGGSLEVFFGGIQCTSPSCAIGLFSSTSTDGGATWSPPTLVINADQAYASDVNASSLPDGTPFETWSHTTGVTVHRGVDPNSPDFDYQGAMGAGCCGYESNLASDGAGNMQLAWDSNATGFLGVWSRPVDPATGAPAGSSMLMPGSVTNFQGTPSHSQMLSRTPIISVPGHPDAFFVAYPGGYPTTTKVLLWLVGSSTSSTVIDEACDHHSVSEAADTSGRIWVFWSCALGSSPVHIYARRIGGAGLEPVIDLGAPPSTASVYALDGTVSPSGDPEVLALVGSSSGGTGTYYARGPQTASPQLERTALASVVSGTVLIKVPGSKGFTALSGSQAIPLGSSVDTRHGTVQLTTARDRRGHLDTGQFSAGQFRVTQQLHGALRPGALTVLTLQGALPCGGRAHDARSYSRSLRSRGRGNFSSRGRYAAATVRGTEWITVDRCNGTLVKVASGSVSVRDFVRRKTVVVRAHHSYLARAPRRR
jgi:hypothetical protein